MPGGYPGASARSSRACSSTWGLIPRWPVIPTRIRSPTGACRATRGPPWAAWRWSGSGAGRGRVARSGPSASPGRSAGRARRARRRSPGARRRGVRPRCRGPRARAAWWSRLRVVVRGIPRIRPRLGRLRRLRALRQPSAPRPQQDKQRDHDHHADNREDPTGSRSGSKNNRRTHTLPVPRYHHGTPAHARDHPYAGPTPTAYRGHPPCRSTPDAHARSPDHARPDRAPAGEDCLSRPSTDAARRFGCWSRCSRSPTDGAANATARTEAVTGGTACPLLTDPALGHHCGSAAEEFRWGRTDACSRYDCRTHVTGTGCPIEIEHKARPVIAGFPIPWPAPTRNTISHLAGVECYFPQARSAMSTLPHPPRAK